MRHSNSHGMQGGFCLGVLAAYTRQLGRRGAVCDSRAREAGRQTRDRSRPTSTPRRRRRLPPPHRAADARITNADATSERAAENELIIARG